MKSYRTLALKELLSQKVTSILILIAVVLSTMMTTIVGQSLAYLVQCGNSRPSLSEETDMPLFCR